MTKQEILQQLKETNIDASAYAINGDIQNFNTLAYNCYSLTKEDHYYEVLQAFRMANTTFSISGYSFIDEDLLSQFWGKYERIKVHFKLLDDLIICNMDWQTFLDMYGYDTEYEALNDTDVEKQIYNCTAKKRIDLINHYTALYNRLYLSEKDIFTIHLFCELSNLFINKYT